MRWAGLIAAGVVGVVVLAGLGAWLALFRDTAEPVTVAEAITSFRTGTETVPETATPIPSGVYVYTTRGYEKTDALTGVTHRYPRRSTITVTAASCGVKLTWRVLKGRSTEWTFCVTDEGWALRTQDERHTFFGRTEATTYTCESTLIRPRARPVGYSWWVSCSTDGASETGRGRIVDRARYSLEGGPSASETHVRKSTTFTGDIRGAARYDFWFEDKTGLLSRIRMRSRTANDSPVGEVHYEEDVGLALTSVRPRK